MNKIRLFSQNPAKTAQELTNNYHNYCHNYNIVCGQCQYPRGFLDEESPPDSGTPPRRGVQTGGLLWSPRSFRYSDANAFVMTCSQSMLESAA